jgi:hypothetical protein
MNITELQNPEQIYFRVNRKKKRRHAMWIVDDFYADPYAIREYALKQEFFDDPGYIGRRTRKQYFFPGLKETFEEIMGMTITEWESHGMNGRFQHNWAGEKLVYHCDFQKWAGMIYLTPDAPFECGTTMYAHKKTRARHNSDPRLDEVFDGNTFVDKTPYEPVDVAGNVFNRLVIFNGGNIHAASEYFGYNLENCRLWQMFFFDTKEDNHNIC